MPRKSDACVRLYWVIDWRKTAVFQKLVTVFETKLRSVLKIFNDVVGTVLKIFKSDCRPDPEKMKACRSGFLEIYLIEDLRISENLSDKKSGSSLQR